MERFQQISKVFYSNQFLFDLHYRFKLFGTVYALQADQVRYWGQCGSHIQYVPAHETTALLPMCCIYIYILHEILHIVSLWPSWLHTLHVSSFCCWFWWSSVGQNLMTCTRITTIHAGPGSLLTLAAMLCRSFLGHKENSGSTFFFFDIYIPSHAERQVLEQLNNFYLDGLQCPNEAPPLKSTRGQMGLTCFLQNSNQMFNTCDWRQYIFHNQTTALLKWYSLGDCNFETHFIGVYFTLWFWEV